MRKHGEEILDLLQQQDEAEMVAECKVGKKKCEGEGEGGKAVEERLGQGERTGEACATEGD